jgi:DNA mismatch repair protein MutS
MAGMPAQVIERSKTILQQLEKSHSRENLTGNVKEVASQAAMQLSFFQLDDPTLAMVREQILNLDINTLTPVEALMKLNDIKKAVVGRSG